MTIDEIFTHRSDIEKFVPPPAPKTGFKGLIEETFGHPNDIYASDLLPSQMAYTARPQQISKGIFEKWSDTYESKTALNPAFQKIHIQDVNGMNAQQ